MDIREWCLAELSSHFTVSSDIVEYLLSFSTEDDIADFLTDLEFQSILKIACTYVSLDNSIEKEVFIHQFSKQLLSNKIISPKKSESKPTAKAKSIPSRPKQYSSTPESIVSR